MTLCDNGPLTLVDLLKIVTLFIGVVAVCFVIPILAILRFEGRRAARAAARLAAGLDAATSSEAHGPGAWKLTAIDGRRAGCEVTLRPKVLGQTVTVGRTRMKAMGVQLTIRGAREIGTGTIDVRRGTLVTTGALAPLDEGVRQALVRCKASLACEGTAVHTEYALPISNKRVDEMLATIDAIGPALALPS